MTCHISDTRIDPREVYGDGYDVDCSCNADKACVECMDGGLYDTITLVWCIGSHQGCDCPSCYTAEQNGGR